MMRKNFDNVVDEIESLKTRVAKLEAEEEREAKQGTIRPGVTRGRKPKEEEKE